MKIKILVYTFSTPLYVCVHYSTVQTFICRVKNISSAKLKLLLFHSRRIQLFSLFGSYICIYALCVLYIIYIYIYKNHVVNQSIVRKGVPASPFFKTPTIDPACLPPPDFLNSLFPLPSFLFNSL